jgi:hypothetical protein
MKSKNDRQRLFEVMGKLDKTFKAINEFDLSTVQRTDAYYNIVEFIGESIGYSNYLHTTNSEEIAKLICSNGFKFEIFQKTTDFVNNIEGLKYRLNIRKVYGNFTVIFQINRSIPNDYESISKKLTEKGEENADIFLLPPQYIKGYFNRTTKEIFANPSFKK